MHGVSEVIAIILILMITISLAGLAYMFMSTTMADVTASAGSTVDTTTSSMMTSFTIESIDIAKVYLRNTGQSALTGLSVYVNDELATFNTTSSIAVGEVGAITIYSFIPDGATVKVTSPNGFSTSKIATPCAKAVGCWKFDETTGTTAYDSSPYGNTGTIYGTNFTSGRYGSGLQFDGVNDYVNAGNVSILNPTTEMTIEAWIKPIGNSDGYIVSKRNDGTINYGIFFVGGTRQMTLLGGGVSSSVVSSAVPVNSWSHVVATINGITGKIYINGVLNASGTVNALTSSEINMLIGARYNTYPSTTRFFNGTIDEVRIYNRVIY